MFPHSASPSEAYRDYSDPAKQLYAQVVLDANQIPYSADGVAELFNAKVAAHEQLRSVFVAPAVPKLPVSWTPHPFVRIVHHQAQISPLTHLYIREAKTGEEKSASKWCR